MRSLSKEPEILNAAVNIIKALENKFTQREKMYLKEMDKLDKEKAVLEIQKDDIVDKGY